MTLLIEHRERVIARCSEFDAGFDDERFIFSYTADHTRPCSPSGVTHRYACMVDKLGIHTHLHAIRHYSATELLASGVDLRTVAGTWPWQRRRDHAQGLRSVGRTRGSTGVGAARRAPTRSASSGQRARTRSSA